jgi:hypothetical protein
MREALKSTPVFARPKRQETKDWEEMLKEEQYLIHEPDLSQKVEPMSAGQYWFLMAVALGITLGVAAIDPLSVLW